MWVACSTAITYIKRQYRDQTFLEKFNIISNKCHSPALGATNIDCLRKWQWKKLPGLWKGIQSGMEEPKWKPEENVVAKPLDQAQFYKFWLHRSLDRFAVQRFCLFSFGSCWSDAIWSRALDHWPSCTMNPASWSWGWAWVWKESVHWRYGTRNGFQAWNMFHKRTLMGRADFGSKCFYFHPCTEHCLFIVISSMRVMRITFSY